MSRCGDVGICGENRRFIVALALSLDVGSWVLALDSGVGNLGLISALEPAPLLFIGASAQRVECGGRRRWSGSRSSRGIRRSRSRGSGRDRIIDRACGFAFIFGFSFGLSIIMLLLSLLASIRAMFSVAQTEPFHVHNMYL